MGNGEIGRNSEKILRGAPSFEEGGTVMDDKK